MKFRFINLGPLKEVGLEVRPLTIIGGISQVGKSFIIKFLYGILSAKASPAEEKERTDKLKRIFQQKDFGKLKNRCSGKLGLITLEDNIIFLTHSHSENKDTLLKKAVENEPDNISLTLVYANFLIQQEQFKNAEKCIQKAMEFTKDDDDDEAAHIYSEFLNKLKKSEKPLEILSPESEERLSEILGAESQKSFASETGRDRFAGELSFSKDQYDDTLQFYNYTLKTREALLGESHPDTATSYSNVGGVYYFKGEYDKALDSYFKALEIAREVFGENHPNTAVFYNNIGLVYYSKGEYDKAIECYSKALKIRMDVLNYRNIAELYTGKGNQNSILECMKKKDIESEFFPKDELNLKPGPRDMRRDQDISYIPEPSENFKKVSYIPSPVILDLFRSIITFRGDKGSAGISDIYWDVLRDIIATGDSAEEIKLKEISNKIKEIIGGTLKYEISKGLRFVKGKKNLTWIW